jgi:hypothetical protein
MSCKKFDQTSVRSVLTTCLLGSRGFRLRCKFDLALQICRCTMHSNEPAISDKRQTSRTLLVSTCGIVTTKSCLRHLHVGVAPGAVPGHSQQKSAALG